MWTVYILQHTETEQIYIGVTKDLKKRIAAHNAGKQRSTIRKQGEWRLVYAEAYRSKEDAIQREQRLKHHGSAKHELLKRVQRCLFSTKTGAG